MYLIGMVARTLLDNMIETEKKVYILIQTYVPMWSSGETQAKQFPQ